MTTKSTFNTFCLSAVYTMAADALVTWGPRASVGFVQDWPNKPFLASEELIGLAEQIFVKFGSIYIYMYIYVCITVYMQRKMNLKICAKQLPFSLDLNMLRWDTVNYWSHCQYGFQVYGATPKSPCAIGTNHEWDLILLMRAERLILTLWSDFSSALCYVAVGCSVFTGEAMCLQSLIAQLPRPCECTYLGIVAIFFSKNKQIMPKLMACYLKS